MGQKKAGHRPEAADRLTGLWLIAALGFAAKRHLRQIVNFGMATNAEKEWLALAL